MKRLSSRPNSLIVLGKGVTHNVIASRDSTFLITISLAK
jgi:hypothetical protein